MSTLLEFHRLKMSWNVSKERGMLWRLKENKGNLKRHAGHAARICLVCGRRRNRSPRVQNPAVSRSDTAATRLLPLIGGFAVQSHVCGGEGGGVGMAESVHAIAGVCQAWPGPLAATVRAQLAHRTSSLLQDSLLMSSRLRRMLACCPLKTTATSQ